MPRPCRPCRPPVLAILAILPLLAGLPAGAQEPAASSGQGVAPSTEGEETVTGSASVALLSQYVFRGYAYGKDSLILQPSLGLTFHGVSLSLWSHADTRQHDTPNFAAPQPGERGILETDYTVSYARDVGPVSVTVGWAWYGTRFAPETEELYVTAAWNVPGAPTLAVYRDIRSYAGTYVNLSGAHSFALVGEATLDVGGSLGYQHGDGSAWRVGPDAHYRALHDGMLRIGATVPLHGGLRVQPLIQWWFPLSDEARDENPGGPLSQRWVVGATLGRDL